jgi:hypothetical protein
MNRSDSLLPSAHPAPDCIRYFFNGLAPVAYPTTREFRGLCPFDLGIKGGHRSVEVATIKRTHAATGMSECPRHRQPRKMYQGELAYYIRLPKQGNVKKLDLLLFQFAKAGKFS